MKHLYVVLLLSTAGKNLLRPRTGARWYSLQLFLHHAPLARTVLYNRRRNGWIL